MKFCKDCKFFDKYNWEKICNYYLLYGYVSPVTGKKENTSFYAGQMRISDSLCGKDAKFFEEKDNE